MTRALSSLVVCTALTLGCSSPTLEEACTDYCESAKAEHCGTALPAECSTGCKQLRTQLHGRCVDEYTELLDCAAGDDFRCVQGVAISTSSSCTNEAIDLAECMGFLDNK